MADINQLVLSGRLTSDPQLHYINRNNEKVAVCNFSIASEDPHGRTSFISIIVWRQYGEAAANYLESGQDVTIVGKLYSRKDPKSSRTFIEVHASEIKYGNKPGVIHE
ncbi:single-stranded DNA-binding protein [Alkalihalophilus marmarensis]|uniref:single-stranded DNA-binding protein n=1 Tax=Alkalihalophilus marmarensis TaxID=521377 RepID=UPI002DBBD892|nr:single-stranded DNA-binding protein [Alkalihalophilus marmarensis]MEC2074279.1 single-stranded DNA-binding protein [Alkalihalophilus marmarensis]